MKQRKDKGKSLAGWIRALLALILVGVLSFCGLFACVMYGAYDHIQGEPEVMVILGCQVRQDGPSVLLRDRLDTALDYLEGHPDLTVVVTGGQDNTVTKTITDPIFEAAVNTKITTHLDVPRGTHSLGAGEFGNDSDVQNAVVEATVHFFADQMK